MAGVPRHEFVPAELRTFAYLDSPLPIGFGKTISQPYIVALMTNLLEIRPADLDPRRRHRSRLPGRGPVQARMRRSTASRSSRSLPGAQCDGSSEQGCGNVEVKIGDGSTGWVEHAPFERILVAAAPDLIPTRPARSARTGRAHGDSGRPRRCPDAHADHPECARRSVYRGHSLGSVLRARRFQRTARRPALSPPCVLDNTRSLMPLLGKSVAEGGDGHAFVAPPHDRVSGRGVMLAVLIAAENGDEKHRGAEVLRRRQVGVGAIVGEEPQLDVGEHEVGGALWNFASEQGHQHQTPGDDGIDGDGALEHASWRARSRRVRDRMGIEIQALGDLPGVDAFHWNAGALVLEPEHRLRPWRTGDEPADVLVVHRPCRIRRSARRRAPSDRGRPRCRDRARREGSSCRLRRARRPRLLRRRVRCG